MSCTTAEKGADYMIWIKKSDKNQMASGLLGNLIVVASPKIVFFWVATVIHYSLIILCRKNHYWLES